MAKDLKTMMQPARTQQDISFSTRQEPHCEYELEDGLNVRVRCVLNRVTWDGKSYANNGLPSYQFNFAQIVDCIPTDEQKEAAEKRVKESGQ